MLVSVCVWIYVLIPVSGFSLFLCWSTVGTVRLHQHFFLTPYFTAGLPEDNSRQTLLRKRPMTLSKSVAEELAIMGGTAGSVDDVDYQVLSRPREKKHSVQAAEGSSAGGPSRYSPPPQPALSPSKATSIPVKQAKLESVYSMSFLSCLQLFFTAFF